MWGLLGRGIILDFLLGWADLGCALEVEIAQVHPDLSVWSQL